ncbi:MAG: hypothetical protein GX303_06345 [Clostridiales bacterium]|nr:hypothetical protein [Clostridiales bacterium]
MEKKNKDAHLEDAFFNNPVASATDRTGYVVTPVGNSEEAENLAQMMSVPVTTHRHNDEPLENKEKKKKKKR